MKKESDKIYYCKECKLPLYEETLNIGELGRRVKTADMICLQCNKKIKFDRKYV